MASGHTSDVPHFERFPALPPAARSTPYPDMALVMPAPPAPPEADRPARSGRIPIPSTAALTGPDIRFTDIRALDRQAAEPRVSDVAAAPGRPKDTGEKPEPVLKPKEFAAKEPTQVYELKLFSKPDSCRPGEPPGDKPEAGGVENDARKGEVVEMTVGQRGPGEDWSVRINRSLVPSDAVAKEIKPTSAAESPKKDQDTPTRSTDVEPASDRAATPEATDGKRQAATVSPNDDLTSKCTVWARVEPRRVAIPSNPQLPPSALDLADKDAGRRDMWLPAMAERTSGSTVLVVRGAGFTEQQRQALGAAVQISAHNAPLEGGDPGRAEKLDELNTALKGPRGDTVMKQDILVGSTDEATLEADIAAIVGSVLPASPDVTYLVPRRHDGRLVTHTDKATAIEAGIDDIYGYMTAADFANGIRYAEMSGVDSAARERYARTYNMPDSTPGVTIGRQIVGRAIDGTEILGRAVRVPRGHVMLGGITGAGKTALAHRWLANATLEAFWKHTNAAKAGIEPPPYARVILDMSKIGNAGDLAEMQDGIRLPDGSKLPREWREIDVISFGNDEVWGNINPLTPPPGGSPFDMVRSDQVAIASTVRHPEAQRVLSKWEGIADVLALVLSGLIKETGESRYEFGTWRDVTIVERLIALGMAVRSSEFQEETQGDIGGYNRTQIVDMLVAKAMQAYQYGYRIDPQRILDNTRTTFVELAGLNDMPSKQYATMLLVGQLHEHQRARHPDGDISRKELSLLFEEGYGLMDSPPGSIDVNIAAERLAHNFSDGRGLGVEYWAMRQGGIRTVHENVDINTITTIWGRTTHGPDLQAINERVPGADQDVVAYLRRAPIGRFLLANIHTPEGPIRVAVTNPDDPSVTPRGSAEGLVRGPERLLVLGSDREFYPGKARAAANYWLLNTNLGTNARQVAEYSTILALTNHPPPNIGGRLRADLLAMGAKPADALKRDASASIAAEASAAGRDLIGYVATHQDFTNFTADSLRTMLQGGRVPYELHPEFALPIFRYQPIITDLQSRLRTDRHPNTPDFEAAVGKLHGKTGQHQLANVDKHTRESLAIVTDAVVPDAPDAAAVGRAVNEIGKLLICTDEQRTKYFQTITKNDLRAQGQHRELTDEEIAATRNHSVADHAISQLERYLGYRLSPEQHTRLAGLVNAFQAQQDDPSAPTIGYAEVRERLVEAIDAKKKATPPLDLAKKYGHLYPKENFTVPDVAPEDLRAHHQLDFVEQRQKTVTDEFCRTNDTTEDEIIVNLAFGRETLDADRARIIWDNLMAQWLKQGGHVPQGYMLDELRAAFNNGKAPSMSLPDLFKRGADDLLKAWSETLSVKIYDPRPADDPVGPDLDVPDETRDFLIGLFFRALDRVYQLGEQQRLQAHENEQAAMASAMNLAKAKGLIS